MVMAGFHARVKNKSDRTEVLVKDSYSGFLRPMQFLRVRSPNFSNRGLKFICF